MLLCTVPATCPRLRLPAAPRPFPPHLLGGNTAVGMTSMSMHLPLRIRGSADEGPVEHGTNRSAGSDPMLKVQPPTSAGLAARTPLALAPHYSGDTPGPNTSLQKSVPRAITSIDGGPEGPAAKMKSTRRRPCNKPGRVTSKAHSKDAGPCLRTPPPRIRRAPFGAGRVPDAAQLPANPSR